jgi:hypothetical protein
VVIVAFLAQFGAFGGAYARWDRLEDRTCTGTVAAFGSHLEGEYGATAYEFTHWRDGDAAARLGTAASLYFAAAGDLAVLATPESLASPPLVLGDEAVVTALPPAERKAMADFVLLADAALTCLRVPGAPILVEGKAITATFDAEFPEARRDAFRAFAADLAGRGR